MSGPSKQMWRPSHERKRPSSTINAFFAHDGALLIRCRDLPRVEALIWHKKRPFHPLRRPSKHIRRPSHQRRRPSVTKSALFAYDCIILSRYGAPSVCKDVLLARKTFFSPTTALLLAETAPLPPAKAPFWHKQALFSLMTAPFEADTGPPTSEGALLARRGVLCVRVSTKYVVVRVVIVT